MSRKAAVAGVDLEIVEKGNGRPLLFLHPGDGLAPSAPWLGALAETFKVIAPWHPGWGGSSLPDWIGTVDDLAYLYLDLAEVLGLENAVIVGSSFGGWVAAEMLVRDSKRFSCAVLADPLGIKVSPPHVRDITDMHGISREEYLKAAFADPKKGDTDFTKLPETELAQIVRGREALALFGWKPYMHNPRLKRWLHRIKTPTLVLWGAQDGVVSKSYCEAWSKEISGARLEVIEKAGHYPHLEQPTEFARRIAAFAG